MDFAKKNCKKLKHYSHFIKKSETDLAFHRKK